MELVRPGAATHEVVAVTTVDAGVVAPVPGDEVVAGAAFDQRIVAASSVDFVVARAATKGVVPRGGRTRLGCALPVDQVIALTSIERVVALEALDPVSARPPGQCVITQSSLHLGDCRRGDHGGVVGIAGGDRQIRYAGPGAGGGVSEHRID